jgi:thiamine biosynthesis lipoprotein ApbE
MTNTVKKTFKLHPDQYEILEAALRLCKQKSGTKFDTVALEYIVQEFMGTGLSFSTLKAALVAEHKKSADDAEYLATVMSLLEEQLPHLKLTLNYEDANAAA